MRKLINLFLKTTANITFVIYQFGLRSVECCKIRIFRKHKKYELFGNIDSLKNKVAVIACFPGSLNNESLIRLVKTLKNRKIWVICVVNQNKHSSHLAKQLVDAGAVVMMRPNIGRDFGAYQAGISFVYNHKNFDLCEELYIFNDSVIYPPKFDELLRKLTSLECDWGTVYLNLEYRLHAQSFALKFSKKVLLEHEFKNFWHEYYPSSDRRRTINKGEVKLSQVMLKLGYQPWPIINQQLLSKTLKVRAFSDEERLTLFRSNDFNGPISELRNVEKLTEAVLAVKAAHLLLHRNPTHFLGAYFTRTVGAPLKLDLIKQGSSTLQAYNNSLVAAGVSAQEINNINNYMLAKGSFSTFKGVKKLWMRHGLI
jgi:hypothetical protein